MKDEIGMTFVMKVTEVQNEITVPKSEYNKFGNYYYRNVEGIQEALKPLLLKHGLMLKVSDEIELIGDRFYVKATAVITDGVNSTSCTAYARETLAAKGMTEPQLTGSSSSYARKYALGGLLLLDDMKDDDKLKGSPEPAAATRSKKPMPAKPAENPEAMNKLVSDILAKMDYLDTPGLEAGIMKAYKKSSFDEFTIDELKKLHSQLLVKIELADRAENQ